MLIAIAASFGVGKALEQSGVAKLFAGLLVEGTRSWGPTATLAAIYFGTMVLNELISNNAAAALSFPFCLESARLLGVSERPFIMAVTLAASYAFASPIGYQTHMMVFGPGGYRFTDFMRVGIPLEPADVDRRRHPDPADLAVPRFRPLGRGPAPETQDCPCRPRIRPSISTRCASSRCRTARARSGCPTWAGRPAAPRARWRTCWRACPRSWRRNR